MWICQAWLLALRRTLSGVLTGLIVDELYISDTMHYDYEQITENSPPTPGFAGWLLILCRGSKAAAR
jgi:hypothetical protein